MQYAQTITMKCEMYDRNWYLKSTIGITFGPRHNSTSISKFYCSFLLFFSSAATVAAVVHLNETNNRIQTHFSAHYFLLRRTVFSSIFPVATSTAGKQILIFSSTFPLYPVSTIRFCFGPIERWNWWKKHKKLKFKFPKNAQTICALVFIQ